MLAPVCLFTYNRLFETQLTIDALKKNKLAQDTELFIFSDHAKKDDSSNKVEAVRQYLYTIDGFKSVKIIESPLNKGLANSIISGVSQVIQKYKKVIVLEDDLITTPNFLNFMNQALDYYSNNRNIQSISAYTLRIKSNNDEVNFQKRPGSWGWATWEDRWAGATFDKQTIQHQIIQNKNILKKFGMACGADMPKMLIDSINDKNDSWYVRWAFDQFMNDKYSVYPAKSYVQNIGFSSNGTHCKGINSYYSELIDSNKTQTAFLNFKTPDMKATREFLYYFTKQHKIKLRISLLKSEEGRKLVFREIKIKLGMNSF